MPPPLKPITNMKMIIPESRIANPSEPRRPKPAAPWRTALVALVGGLVLTGCNRQPQAPPQAMPEVAAITVTTQQVVLTTELPGRTAPYLIAEIRPQVNGLVQKRLFTEGADVKQGQELYQIDPAPFQAALENAKAALGRSEASLPAIRSRADRFKQALAEKAVSQQDYDDADAALKQALADVEYWKAMVTTAGINLGYARVTSPISGRIGKSTVTDGAIVTAYQPTPLTTIQQLDPIYVDVTQSANELLRLQRWLKRGQLNSAGTSASKVRLILGDGTPYPLEGELQFRDVSVDPTTASVTLRMVFPNPEGVLLPGMYVRALLKEGVNEAALLIPQQTVARNPKGNPYVMLVNAEGKVEQRQLTLERAIGDQWLVSGGLTPGDRVIVEGLQKVRPGVPVKVVAPGESGKAAANAATPAQPASTPNAK